MLFDRAIIHSHCSNPQSGQHRSCLKSATSHGRSNGLTSRKPNLAARINSSRTNAHRVSCAVRQRSRSLKLGNSDIDVGRVAWGCWRLANDDLEALTRTLETLRECGIRTIDNAAIYGYGTRFGAGHAETMLGRAFREQPSLRDDFVVITKGGLDLPAPYDSSRAALIAACDASLSRLGVDAIDVYMIHRPDLLTAADEVADALNTLLRSGKVRQLGVSNHTPAQVAALAAFLDTPLVCHEVELSAWQLAPLEDGVIDQCQQLGMTPIAWSPLAGGGLTGDSAHEASADSDLLRLCDTLDAIAAEHDCDRATLALAFVLMLPGVLPILGSQRPARIRAAMEAEALTLTRRQWYRIFEARQGIPMP